MRYWFRINTYRNGQKAVFILSKVKSLILVNQKRTIKPIFNIKLLIDIQTHILTKI